MVKNIKEVPSNYQMDIKDLRYAQELFKDTFKDTNNLSDSIYELAVKMYAYGFTKGVNYKTNATARKRKRNG